MTLDDLYSGIIPAVAPPSTGLPPPVAAFPPTEPPTA
jgi:hypothetical protein